MHSVYKKLIDSPRWFLGCLIGAGVLAILVALAIGLQQSVWFDEAYSIRVAQSSWGQLFHLTAVDTHPPMYYALLKLWAGLFGWSEVSLRLLSATFYGGSIVMAGLVVRRLFGTKIALHTLPFLLLSPLLIRYGFEIRAYSLASLIGVAATYGMLRATETKGWSRWWAFYAVLVALGTLSLYYLVLLWVAHLLWLLSQTKHSFHQLIRAPWVKAYGLSVLLFALWLGQFIHQTTNGALAPISQVMTLDNLMGILTFNTLYRPVWQLDAISSLLAVFAIGAIFWLIIRASNQLRSSEKSGFRLLLLYIVVPIAMLTLISLIKPMYVERYLSHVAIGGVMLIGVSAAIVYLRHSSPIKHVLILGLLAVMSLGVVRLSEVGNYNFQRLDHPAIKQASQVITGQPSKLVVANDPYVMTELGYYLPTDGMRFFSQSSDLGGGYAPWSESSLRLDPSHYELPDEFWYVYYEKPAVEVTDEGYGLVSVREYGALKVAEYRR